MASTANIPAPIKAAANAIVAEWLAELGIKTKFEAAGQICNYFKTGMIHGTHAIKLIMQLGYTRKQATRMLSLCYLHKLPSTYSQMPAKGTKAYDEMEQAIQE